MISPHTPPGTRIVCVLDFGIEKYVTEGQVYVLEEIFMLRSPMLGVEAPLARLRGVMCTCGGHLRGFALLRFKIAELPETLTECLNGAPVDTDMEVVS